MSPANQKLILAVIELMLNVGVPTAIEALKNFDVSDNPSAEEIRKLSDQLKPPDEYWNE